jgi:Family of unknown function (DUF6088)
MTVSQKIEQQLQQIPEGTTFRYQGLSIESSEYPAASKTIERLITKGTLQRASKGVFYKPKQTVFGALQPSENELLKQYLFKDGQRVAYITGASLYNEMGLTTQVPFVITIASKTRRAFTSINYLTIKPAKSYVEVTDDNYKLLGILDAIKDFNRISDRDKNAVITILTNKLKALMPQETANLIKYGLDYPPRVRALLGAMLERANKSLELNTLKASLNPLSKYNYGINNNDLPNALKWQLK